MDTDSRPVQTNGQAAGNGRPCPGNADEFFHRALDLHRQGEADSAAALYQQAISLCPEHVDACFYLALLHRAMGAPEEAALWFGRAHALLPKEAAIAYELGTTCYSLGQHQMAIEHFQKVLSLGDTHWQAAYNLGTAHLARGNTSEAIKAYHRAAQQNPQDADIHFNLGLACKRAGRLEEAMQSYLCAMEIAPDDAEVHYNLALVYKELGCRDEAIACYRRLIELDHNAASARHILAALTGETTAVAPSSYIAELFDSFSAHFEERLLVDLEYRTPWELKSLLLAAPDGPARFERLLDLGCGTGLVGQVFQEISVCRVGVDLSPKMVEAAAAKKVYDELVVAEIVTFLEQNQEPFDLIVAADVLIYVGELDRIFATLARGLARNGRILFSTEQMAGQGYQLRQSGRYAHSFSYILAMAARHGFRVLSTQSANIRKEKGRWIAGDLYLLGV